MSRPVLVVSADPQERQNLQHLFESEGHRVEVASPSEALRRLKNFKSILGEDVTLAELERLHIERLLKRHRGNKQRVARILDIDRTTLYNKLRRYQG